MRKYLKAILFLAAAVALMSVTALAADGEGICEVETYNSAVTVTPLTAEGTEASENSEGVYVGAVKVQVTYTGAVKDSYYLVLALTDGATTPKEENIAYIDQSTGAVDLKVYPASLTTGQTYDVYLSSNDGTLGYTKVASFGYYAPYTLGDVNNDNGIDVSDAMAIINHIVSKSTLEGNSLLAADTNKDNNVDVSDAMLIINYIVGKISEL